MRHRGKWGARHFDARRRYNLLLRDCRAERVRLLLPPLEDAESLTTLTLTLEETQERRTELLDRWPSCDKRFRQAAATSARWREVHGQNSPADRPRVSATFRRRSDWLN